MTIPSLRYGADWRSLLFVAIAYFLLLFPLFYPMPFILAGIWIFLSSLFCFCVGIINHNHMHLAMFKQQWMNQLFNIVLTPCMGHTATEMVIPHNYNHHVHNGDCNDWSKAELAGTGIGAIRLLRYVIGYLINIAQRKRNKQIPTLPKHLQRSLLREKITLGTFTAIGIAIAGLKMLIFVILPWTMGIICLLGVNLLQHDGCYPQSPYAHSRNFTSSLGNWFFFNNGYHTIHHLRPHLHWSKLPKAHDRLIKPHLSQQLEVKSILTFVWTQYLFKPSTSTNEKSTNLD